MHRSRRNESTGQRDAVGRHEEGEIALHILIVQSEGGGSLPQSGVDHQQDGQDGDHQGGQHEGSAEDRAQPHLRFGPAGPEENGDDGDRRFRKCGTNGRQHTADRAFGQIESLAHPLDGVRK